MSNEKMTTMEAMELVNTELAALNALIKDGKNTEAAEQATRTALKKYNAAVVTEYAATIRALADDKGRTEAFAYYLDHQTCKGLSLAWEDDEHNVRTVAPKLCRVSLYNLNNLFERNDGYFFKGGIVTWKKALEAFCDNLALAFIGDDAFERRLPDGTAYASPVEMKKFKEDNGFTCKTATPSMTELCRQLDKLFELCSPDGFDVHAVKADVKYLASSLFKSSRDVKNVNGKLIQSATTTMEYYLIMAMTTRYYKRMYETVRGKQTLFNEKAGTGNKKTPVKDEAKPTGATTINKPAKKPVPTAREEQKQSA